MRNMFRNFPTEKINLYKKSGEVIEDIEALVEPKKIFIDDASVIIEEEDIFERNLPNGAVEQYKVLDRGFYKGMHGIPDHYQVSVEKVTSLSRRTSGGAIYNIQNDGGKVNIHSMDNSVSISITANDEKLFETLVQLAEHLQNKEEIIKAVKEMRQEVGKPSFADKYNTFVQSVANHITIFAPFIPTLTNFLTR